MNEYAPDQNNSPSENPTEGWSRGRRVASQLGTRLVHYLEQSVGGADEQTDAARTKRDEERRRVGLPPLYEDQ